MPFYPSTSERTKAPAIEVSTRAAWADEWVVIKGLWCRHIEFASNAGMPEAQLVWHYGTISAAPGIDPRITLPRLTIGPSSAKPGDWVRIRVDPNNEADVGEIPTWIGRVVEEVDQQNGNGSGAQTFVCWGMESVLADSPILSSIVNKPSGDEVEIGRVVGFNMGKGHAHDHRAEAQPNRSLTPGISGNYVFAYDLAAANCELWTAAQISDYALYYFAGRDALDARAIVFRLVSDRHLETTHPKVLPEAWSVKKLLDHLMDRRRALGWSLAYSEADNAFDVVPFTCLPEDIWLPDGTDFPANSDQVDLDFSDAIDLVKCELRTTEATRYDQVIARGEPMGAVFQVSTDDMVPDWTDDDATAYRTAASGAADYSGLNPSEKQYRNDNFRMEHTGAVGERIRRVYAWFHLHPSWAGQSYSLADVLHPMFQDFQGEAIEVDFATEAAWWRPGLLLEHELPMDEAEDYSGSRVIGELTTRIIVSPLKPLVVIKLEHDAGRNIDPLQFVDKLSAGAANELIDEGGRGWSASVHTRRDDAGFVLRVSGHAQQHKIAKNHFTGIDATDDIPVDLDYSDLAFTVCLALDQRAEIRVPSDGSLAAGDAFAGRPLRRLVVEVPGAHCDYVMGGTLTGIKDGVQQSTTDSGILRSDAARLASIATLGAAWYAVERRTLNIELAQIHFIADVGSMIATIANGEAAQTVNTVVTRVRYDFDAQKTVLQTSHADLDLKAM